MLTSLCQHFGTGAIDYENIEAEVNSTVTKRQRELNSARSQGIPRFFFAKPKNNHLSALVEAAVSETAVNQTPHLSHGHLDRLTALLHEHAQEPKRSDAQDEGEEEPSSQSASQKRLSYAAFCQVAKDFTAEFGSGCRFYFDPATFLSFEADPDGAVSLGLVFEYITALSERVLLWKQLQAVDDDHDGLLTLAQVECVLVSLADELGYQIPADLLPYWRVIAPRKVFFHLGHNGFVSIKDILADQMLDEFCSYYNVMSMHQSRAHPAYWFAPEKTMDIHMKLVELDADGDELLTPAEVSRVRVSPGADGGEVSSMVDFFLTRVFEEHVQHVSPVTGETGMNLAEFADFLLAWNFRGHLPSVRYFFRVLDVEGRGKLSGPVVALWCRHVAVVAVHKMGILYDYEPLDVKDEIFDMVTPKDPDYITLQDLMDSGMADKICGMLVDGMCHYEYDQREALQAKQAE